MPDIIDAHHHVWRQADLPWLNGPTIPRIFGPYDSIKRDYLIEEYLADIEGSGVSKSIYVQANWAVEDAVEEVRWLQSCADRTGWPHAVVGYCDLFSDNLSETLTAQAAASDLLRGMRMQLHWHEVHEYRFAPAADTMKDKKLQSNLAKIQDFGWLFELQVFPAQMKDAAELVAKFPQIDFVLIHGGMPEDLSDTGYAAWESGMRRLADNPNCFTKLSGLGTFTHSVDRQNVARIVDSCIQIFGADRCVFGSNFPIEKIWASFSELMGAYHECLSTYPDSVQQSIFHDNAARLYRL